MQQEVLKFWFEDLQPSQWWTRDDALDTLIKQKFSAIHSRAAACELFTWRQDPRGRLAEIIILDQFSRNMFRGTALSFAYDSLALVLAQEAIAAGADTHLTPLECSFLYLPFMHSESLTIHEIATDLYKKDGLESNYDFELKHKTIIQQFGRYPHRNEILNRTSSAEEIAFLKQPGSSF